MRRVQPLVTTGLLFLVALLGANVALLVGSRDAEPEGGAQVRAYGTIGAQGATAAVAASLAHPANRSARAVAVQDALGSVGVVTVDADTGRTGGAGVATATIRAEGLSLLGGRVAVDAVEGRVWVRADGTAADARVTSFAADGVRVDGVPVTVGLGATVPVPGAGEVGFGEVASDGAGSVRFTLVRVSSDAAYAPSATLAVGHADARAVPGPAAASAPSATPAPRPVADPEAPTAPARTRTLPEPIPETPDVVTAPPAAGGGAVPVVPYTPVPPADPAVPTGRLLPGTPDAGNPVPAGANAFPVLGDASFTDDYGAARAVTGWHHGNDLFAPVGAPVVAVADGTLSRVGWNTLGGNRLWLTDDAGTAYYYAHLSAYAPVAAEGARVRAGEVIAYVGNTGQAATTPPHLHFEVHPGGSEAPAVDPYPLLQAWRAGEPTGAVLPAAAQAAPDAAAGAVVVGIAPERDEGPGGGEGLAVSAR